MKEVIKIQKGKSGITLVALVVTIVILLILVGLSIATLMGENGLLKKATEAKKEAIIGKEKEQILLAYNATTIKIGQDTIDVLVTAADLNTEFQTQNAEAIASGESPITVEFTKTGNIYTIDTTSQELIIGPINDTGGGSTDEEESGEVTEIPEGYIKPSGTMPIATNGEYDVTIYEKVNVNVQTDKKYTQEEYDNYGNSKYNQGVYDNANAQGYKSGVLSPSTTGKYFLECGFKPRYVVIKLKNTDGSENVATLFYDEDISTTNSYLVNTVKDVENEFIMEGEVDNISNAMHIYKITDSGFGFYFSNAERIMYWTAFK